jgi:GntR family transcriptional regulator
MGVYVEIDPADDRPIYLQIMDEVRRARVIGTLAADEPLPSVRELASRLRVNANTVAQAYRELEREGTVYVRRGQGTFATESRADEGARERLAREVAERARRDAYRHGVALDELIDALGEARDRPMEEER